MSIIALILAWVVFPAMQQQEIQQSREESLLAAEVSAFADSFFVARMDEMHVPGVAFVVVQDSAILVAKGYGYADIEANHPIDPYATLFQAASVSKLFTATAVMQQVEEGRLSLDADVNTYLNAFQIEGAFGEPVTLSHLLTHTAGLDERNIGYFARDSESIVPLDAYLANRMPPRTLAPGTVFSYSNHGFGLAGYLVELSASEPFADYAGTRILRPLGMSRSTFKLPLPDSLATYLAQGYNWKDEIYEPTPLVFRNVPPAGALSTTAADMARFIIAQLNEGRLESTQLLQKNSIAEMHRQQFTHHLELPGMAYGFMEQYVNGLRALQHGGDIPGFRSLFFLLPERHTGFFVAYNANSSALRRELVGQFMDRFYPDIRRVQPMAAEGNADLSRYEGVYMLNRYGRRSLEKLFAVFNNSFSIWSDTEGYVVTQDGQQWVGVDSLLFRQPEHREYLAFKANESGQITHLFRSIDLGGSVPGAYEKLSWYETPTFVNEFYLSWIPVLLITCIIWPIGFAIRYLWSLWRKKPAVRWPRSALAARWIASLFSLGAIWFAVAFIRRSLRMIEQGGGELLYGMPADMNRLLWIPEVQVVLLIALFVFTFKAWTRKYWSLVGRVHYTVVTLAALAWVLFAVQYNLIGHLY